MHVMICDATPGMGWVRGGMLTLTCVMHVMVRPAWGREGVRWPFERQGRCQASLSTFSIRAKLDLLKAACLLCFASIA